MQLAERTLNVTNVALRHSVQCLRSSVRTGLQLDGESGNIAQGTLLYNHRAFFTIIVKSPTECTIYIYFVRFYEVIGWHFLYLLSSLGGSVLVVFQ